MDLTSVEVYKLYRKICFLVLVSNLAGKMPLFDIFQDGKDFKSNNEHNFLTGF